MARSTHIIKRLHSQRGGVAIWFVLCLPVLLGCAALAVDLARLNLIRTELQNAADAAALGGARSLSDAGGNPYNWTAAVAMAQTVAQSNFADGAQIQLAQVSCEPTPYYWHLPKGDVPAIKVTITMPSKLLFAPIWGINQQTVQATATAVIAPPASGTGIFPFAISKKMFDTYWDSVNNKPQVDCHNNPIELKYGMNSVYFDKLGNQYTSGTWTTFDTTPTSASNVKKYLEGDLTSNANIGMNIHLESGVDDNAFHITGKDYTNKDVLIVVVDDVVPGSTVPIYAIGGFHIDGVDKIKGKSYISGHFIDPSTFSTTNPGNGNGTSYGAYTPPLLVE
jgi:hypothetical protein